MPREKRCVCFGSSRLAADSPGARLAHECGRTIAELGWTVVTGGYEGAMGAVSRGARDAGGRVLYRTASYYLNKFVGEGAARMRADFEALEDAYRETGVRSLLVIDEIEAIALDRTLATGTHAGYLDVLDTLLSLVTRSEVRILGISNLASAGAGMRYVNDV